MDGSGLGGIDWPPEIDDLFLFRHNFRMLFIDTSVERVLLGFKLDCWSSFTESTEKRLEGARLSRSLVREEVRSGGAATGLCSPYGDDGKRPKGSGDRGMPGESDRSSALRPNEGGSA